MIRKEYGTVKLLVYRKKTHTDQYLNFTSHHLLHQKLGSSKRYWIDATTSYQSQRTERKRTEKEDREKEVEHITKALERCGYHKEGERTAISKMENQRKEGKQHREIQRYGHTSVYQRSNRICTADFKTQTLLHRLHQNSRRILVHPKENVEDSKKTDCVYQISCKTCNDTHYIGERGRTFGTRLEEHKKEVENITTRRFTREQKRVSTGDRA